MDAKPNNHDCLWVVGILLLWIRRLLSRIYDLEGKKAGSRGGVDEKNPGVGGSQEEADAGMGED